MSDLIDRYLKAEYRVYTATDTNILKIAQKSDFLERANKLHLTDRSAFITACNPASQIVSDIINEAATEQMNEDISEHWPKYFAEAADPMGAWPPEASYLVMGIDYRDAIELAHKYNQNAFLYAYKEPVLRLYLRDSSAVPNNFPYGYKPHSSDNTPAEKMRVTFIPESKQNETSTGAYEEKKTSRKVYALISYINERKFVCPRGKHWDALWKMLPDRKRSEGGWEPPPPLILSAWYNSKHIHKIDRLILHIFWADKKNALDKVDSYLRGLRDEDWLKWDEKS